MTEELLELGERVSRAVAVALLAVGVVVGSAVLWIGLPAAGLWVAGEVTDSADTFLFVVLLGIPLSMVAFGWLLYRLNALYEDMRGGPAGPPHRSAWLASSSAERETLRRARGPRTLLDVSMTASAVAALLLIAIWFFFFADSPLAPS